MINVIAVDDEVNALGIIHEFCQNLPQVNLCETFSDPLLVLPYLNTHQNIDLVFLDIQMARLNGLSVAQRLQENNIGIIITTAYPEFALQGYELNVVDYLLKPFSFSRFEKSIQKFMAPKMPLTGTEETNNPKKPTPGEDYIFVKTSSKTVRVNLADIQYLEGSGNYVTLHTKTGKILVLQNMKNFEEHLRPHQFVRIHRSYIISMKEVDSIEKNYVKIGKEELPIGEGFKVGFQQFLEKHYKQF